MKTVFQPKNYSLPSGLMDKISKYLKRLSTKERAWVEQTLVDILDGNLTGYDLKKMRGHANLYRIRIGQIRIIYIEGKNDTKILMIDRRNDNTYKDF